MRASRRCARASVRRLEWKVQAENDLFDILDYIGHDNPDAAVELVQKIRTKVDGLRERPTLYRAGRIRSTREMIVHRKLHRVLQCKR
ncbi:ParE toxin of type II toxin-antitoxin system, parDE [Burkholderia sp. D7]|nr:ParE toxin of type II toxin-antitoxin system, parDE [Burkholderia sp. D7]